jgi:2,3-bisphosphoglycerate-independent phosphoglycerate mutase
MGLTSDGGAHSHINHFLATIEFFAKNNLIEELFIHAFTDGRDSPPDSAKLFLDQIQSHINTFGIGKIATLCGRSIAMDRNSQWDRTKKIYDLLTQNIGITASNYESALLTSYTSGLTDEFIQPTVLVPNSNIRSNDVVIFLNFRPDRALQLTQSLIDTSFNHFPRVNISPVFFASMVEYRKDYPQKILFPKQYINVPLGSIIASQGLSQLRIAESEKFPHVTYFFNGGKSVRFSKEDRIEIPSPAVPTYDLKPEMSALQLTDALINRIKSDIYDLIVVNFANPDMVGHTGSVEATIKAVSVVDYCTKELVNNFTAKGGAVLITADHGNAEEVINLDTGEIDTEHSLNPVPLMIVGTNLQPIKLQYGALKDITPTILDIMGIPKPAEMTGISLLTDRDFLK